jgi:hypothetical protein
MNGGFGMAPTFELGGIVLVHDGVPAEGPNVGMSAPRARMFSGSGLRGRVNDAMSTPDPIKAAR